MSISVLGTTQFTYAVNNRLYAKKTRSREIASVVVMQSYYTNENAATYDRTQSSGYGTSQPTHFGGVIVSARGSPDRSHPGRLPNGMGSDRACAEDFRQQRHGEFRRLAADDRHLEPAALYRRSFPATTIPRRVALSRRHRERASHGQPRRRRL